MMLDALLMWAAAASGTPTAALPNTPVTELNLPRYMGTWHEIARLPQKFQAACVGDVTATYKLKANDRIEVTNACRKADNSRMVAVGEAKPTDKAAGALKVRFAPKWLSWLGAVWGDYWIVDLEPDYQWVMIGSPNKDYLWILARKASMTKVDFQRLKDDAARRGYPVTQLIVSGEVQ
jgi:apolipoprotein D and lipocalin family protein